MAHRGPYVNLKAVVHQTGVKPDTLRAWERRYGLPSPGRSGGKHRLYSERDVETVKWLVARQHEGLSISRAVELWRALEAGGQDPLQALAAQAQAPVPHVAGGALEQLRDEWLAACLAFDEQRAEAVLAQAFALYAPERVCLDLLRSGIAEVGELWYEARATVQQEHFATELALRRLESLIMAAPPPWRAVRILAACPLDEHHVFGLLLLTFLLRRRGWAVIYLGASVPVEQLESTVAAVRPGLVVLAAQQLHSAATLLEAAQALQGLSVTVAYGGRVFSQLPDLRRRIPGHFLGGSIEEALWAVESLLARPGPGPELAPVPVEHQRALEYFRDHQSLIEAHVLESGGAAGISAHHLSHANRQMALDIEATLRLGELDLLGSDLAWAEGLLDQHQLPAGMLLTYLRAYRQAIQANLEEGGELLLTWFGQFADSERRQSAGAGC